MINPFKKKTNPSDNDVNSILKKKGIRMEDAEKIGIESIAFSEGDIPKNAIEEIKKLDNIIVEENGKQFLGLNEILMHTDPQQVFDNVGNFCSIFSVLITVAKISPKTMLTVNTAKGSFRLKAKDAVKHLFNLMRKN